MKPRMKPRWTYGLGLIPLASLVIGVMPAYSGQQSAGQSSGGQSDQQAHQGQRQQAQSQQNQSRSQEGEWQSVSGTIRKMRTFLMANGEDQNLVVQVQTDQGRPQTIDLGNAEYLQDFNIERGDRITAWGKMKTISGRQVLMAKKLKIDGEKITIDRPEFSPSFEEQARQPDQDTAQQGQGQNEQSLKKIKGEVVGAGEVVAYDRKGNVVESESDAFYIVEDANGRQSELLVGEEIDPWLHVGDSIEATVAPDGRVVAISRGTGGSEDQPEMKQSGRAGQDQGNRSDQLSRQQPSGEQQPQDQAGRQQQFRQSREQTARQSEEERR